MATDVEVAAGSGIEAARLLASSSAPYLGAPEDGIDGVSDAVDGVPGDGEDGGSGADSSRPRVGEQNTGAMLDAFSKSKNAYHLTETAHDFFDMIEETCKTRKQLEALAKKTGCENYATKFASFEHIARQERLDGGNPLHMTLDDVFSAAEATYETFADEMRLLASGSGGELIMAPLKTRERAEAKVRHRYEGMNCKINDIVRCSIVCNSEIELVLAGIGFASLVSTQAVSIVRLKNHFKDPRWNGYRDALYTVRVRVPRHKVPGYEDAGGGGDDDDDGEGRGDLWHNCECQLHLRPFYGLSPSSLAAYTRLRPYFRGMEAVFAERIAMVEDLNRSGPGGVKALAVATCNNRDEVKMLALEDLLAFRQAEAFELATLVCRGRLGLAVSRGDDLGAIKAQRQLIKYALAGGDDAEALAIGFLCFNDCRQKLGLRHSEGARVQAEVSHVLEKVGRGEEALDFIREAHEVLEALEGPNHEDTLDAAIQLATFLVKRTLVKEAEPILARVYEIQRRDYGEFHSYALTTLSHLVPLRIFRGCVDEAMPDIEGAIFGWNRLHGPTFHRVSKLETFKALVLGLEDKVDAALPLAKGAYANMVDKYGATHADALLPAALTGVLLEATGADDAAVQAHLATAVGACGYGAFHPELAFLKAKLTPITGEFHAFAKALKKQIDYVETDLRPEGVALDEGGAATSL